MYIVFALFFALFAVTQICLYIGLVRPKLFNPVFKTVFSRSRIALIFGLPSLLFFGIAALAANKVADSTPKKPPVEKVSKPAVNPTPTKPPSNPTPNPTLTPTQQSPAYKLAVLEKGVPNPDKLTVDVFDGALKILNRKCSEDDELRIADILVAAREQLQKRGVKMSLIQVAESVDDSIPAEASNSVSCAETAAAFVTLTSP